MDKNYEDSVITSDEIVADEMGCDEENEGGTD